MRKKKLLIATDAFLPRWDGVARFVSEIIPELTDMFSITVVAPRFAGRAPVMKGIRLITIPTYSFRISDYNPPQFDTKTISDEVRKADIVWAQTVGPIGGSAIYYANKVGTKVISYVHSVEWELIPESLPRSPLLRMPSAMATRKIAKTLYSRVDLLLVPSREVAAKLNKNEIFAKKRIVPMGVDVETFVPPRSKSDAKRRLHLDPGLFVVGFCGRIAREKDLMTLYRAFLHVNKKHPNTLLLIVGEGLKKVQKAFSHKSALVVGPSDDVLPYFQAMDVHVLPSLTETSSLSTMEAMACGVPVLVTPVGNIVDYVKDYYNGLIFPTGDSKKLAEQIETLLLDKRMRLRMGNNARKTIVRHHRFDRTAKKVREILSKL
jgi:glycosyltransferase involved in cell wall biosynthesis